MRKIIMVCLIVFIAGALYYPFMNIEKDVDIKTLIPIVEKYAKKSELQVQDIKKLGSSYKIKSSEIESFISYGPVSYMNVDEITLIKQDDAVLRKNIIVNAKGHIQTQLKSFEGYGVEQTKLLKESKVIEIGNYVICIVAINANEIAKEIKDCF